MTDAAHLVARVKSCGYAVLVCDGAPVLLPARSECVMPARLLADLKAHRAAVVAHLATLPPELCAVCSRDVSDPRDRAALASNHLLCDRGGSAKAVADGNGRAHPATIGCPWKPQRERQ